MTTGPTFRTVLILRLGSYHTSFHTHTHCLKHSDSILFGRFLIRVCDLIFPNKFPLRSLFTIPITREVPQIGLVTYRGVSIHIYISYNFFTSCFIIIIYVLL